MSPKRSIHSIASSPGSAEPDNAVTRSEERSREASVSSGSRRIRCTITGTAASTSARCSCTARAVRSGSKRRCRTIVDAVGRLMMK